MGIWSRLAGDIFLDWLAPTTGLRWIDIGCGNGAFTELIINRCAPAEVQGVDPSQGQLAFARARFTARVAQFQQGDAMVLPFSKNKFDVAVMALVKLGYSESQAAEAVARAANDLGEAAETAILLREALRGMAR